jgi:hypothetical protein
MLSVKCCFIWPNGFRGEDFLKLTNQKQELPMVAMFVNKMSNLYRGPSIDASYQASGQFGQVVSEEKIFRDQPTRNKNCLWKQCL